MSRPLFPASAWPIGRMADLAETDIPAQTIPLGVRDPRRITVVIRGETASVGYAVSASAPDVEWCIEGPMRAEDGLALAQLLSSAAGLPIILSRAGDCRSEGEAH